MPCTLPGHGFAPHYLLYKMVAMVIIAGLHVLSSCPCTNYQTQYLSLWITQLISF